METVSDSQARRRTSAAINVAAAKCDGMRRQLVYPEIEQVDRLRRFLAGMPSALRV
jgi:hypothetical protein